MVRQRSVSAAGSIRRLAMGSAGSIRRLAEGSRLKVGWELVGAARLWPGEVVSRQGCGPARMRPCEDESRQGCRGYDAVRHFCRGYKEMIMERDEVVKVVIKNIRLNSTGLDGVEIDPNKSMADYGVSSLDIVETVSASMRELRVRIPRRELANLTNINELVDALLNARMAAEAQKAAEGPA